VFTSVTALPIRRVSVGAPFASEPPAIVITAVFFVTFKRWKSGDAAGKSASTFTPSGTPPTEMVAETYGTAAGFVVGVVGTAVGDVEFGAGVVARVAGTAADCDESFEGVACDAGCFDAPALFFAGFAAAVDASDESLVSTVEPSVRSCWTNGSLLLKVGDRRAS